MILVTTDNYSNYIVHGAYNPTYNWVAPHCSWVCPKMGYTAQNGKIGNSHDGTHDFGIWSLFFWYPIFRRTMPRFSWAFAGELWTPTCLSFSAPNCCIQFLTNSLQFLSGSPFSCHVFPGVFALRSIRHLCGAAKPVSRKVCDRWWVFLIIICVPWSSLLDYLWMCIYNYILYIYIFIYTCTIHTYPDWEEVINPWNIST